MDSELEQLMQSMNQIDISIDIPEAIKQQAEQINQQVIAELTQEQQQLITRKQVNEQQLLEITQKRSDLEQEVTVLEERLHKESLLISQLKNVNTAIQSRAEWIKNLREKYREDDYILDQISKISDQEMSGLIKSQNLGFIIEDSQRVNNQLTQLKEQLKDYEEKLDQIQTQLDQKVMIRTNLQLEFDRVKQEYDEIADQIPNLPLNNGQTLHKNISTTYLKVKTEQQQLLTRVTELNERGAKLRGDIHSQKAKKLQLMMESKLLEIEFKGRLDVLHFLDSLKQNYRSSINQTEHDHQENVLYMQKNQARIEQLEKMNSQLQEKVQVRGQQFNDKITALQVFVVILFFILNYFIYWVKRVDPIIADVEIGL